jgi:hypothetical protein
LKQSSAGFPVRQAAVWIVTDDADYAELGSLLDSAPMPFRRRVIGVGDAARAMARCQQAGIDVRKRAIWKDREILYRYLYWRSRDDALIGTANTVGRRSSGIATSRRATDGIASHGPELGDVQFMRRLIQSSDDRARSLGTSVLFMQPGDPRQLSAQWQQWNTEGGIDEFRLWLENQNPELAQRAKQAERELAQRLSSVNPGTINVISSKRLSIRVEMVSYASGPQQAWTSRYLRRLGHQVQCGEAPSDVSGLAYAGGNHITVFCRVGAQNEANALSAVLGAVFRSKADMKIVGADGQVAGMQVFGFPLHIHMKVTGADGVVSDADIVIWFT